MAIAIIPEMQQADSNGSQSFQSRPSWDVRPSEGTQQAVRVLNVIVAVVALVIVAPVMAVVALAVRLTSRGPVLYTQPRVGMDRRWRHGHRDDSRRTTDLGGQIFRIYKFRTMRVDAERGSGAVWAIKRDDRVTPIGGFLRKTRLDELPQLFNVIKGDMNIVGPRPERPSLFIKLSRQIDGYAVRQRTRPGITGWAQINQAYDTCLDDVRSKVAFDIEYLRRQSVWTDLKIMALTIPVMASRKFGW